MSGHGVLLPLTPDQLEVVQTFVDDWNEGLLESYRYPRSAWLRGLEDRLAAYYPQASSRDLSLTARHYAPFPLEAGHDVP